MNDVQGRVIMKRVLFCVSCDGMCFVVLCALGKGLRLRLLLLLVEWIALCMHRNSFQTPTGVDEIFILSSCYFVSRVSTVAKADISQCVTICFLTVCVRLKCS